MSDTKPFLVKAPHYASDRVSDITFCELYDAAAGLMKHLGENAGHNKDWPLQMTVQTEGDAQALAKRLTRLERILRRLTRDFNK